MSKNNVKGALDDWGFDAPKSPVKQETKTVESVVKKSESQVPVKSGNKQVDQNNNKSLVKEFEKPKAIKQNIRVIGKSESQEVEDKLIDQSSMGVGETIEKVILKSKTFDLPPILIRRIKMEAAANDKKEYQIALEAFEQYFQESF